MALDNKENGAKCKGSLLGVENIHVRKIVLLGTNELKLNALDIPKRQNLTLNGLNLFLYQRMLLNVLCVKHKEIVFLRDLPMFPRVRGVGDG